MVEHPILLFLHGVGEGDLENTWRGRLSETLTTVGFPGLDEVDIVAPKYADALFAADAADGVDVPGKLPAITIKKLSGDAAKARRREFEQATAAMEYRLGRHQRGKGGTFPTAVVDFAVDLPWFLQARNYLTSPRVRARVLNHILRDLPHTGRMVIIGHSLGSVIAADILRRLPENIEVAGMVTIGSPLANGNFNVDKLQTELQQPPGNLAWWVNFWSGSDPVAAKRGVSSVFPWMLDFRIRTSLAPGPAHSAQQYLADEAVGEAIGFGLFGSRSREIVVVDRGIDIAMDNAELLTVLALRYCHLIRKKLKGTEQERYTGALRQVQAGLIDDMKARNLVENRPLPREIHSLEFDFSDSREVAPEPPTSRHLSKDTAVSRVLALATENLIRPFEISVKEEIRLEALKDLTEEMGLGSQFGEDVFTAVKTANKALSGVRKTQWVKWGALGAGALAIMAASGGLVLAAAPGLAGAAAITSALAGFGPGGMIGGLLTAGTLVSAGSGGIALGVLSPSTSAESMEAVVEYQLAVVIVRKLQGLEQDPTIWSDLTQAETTLRREKKRLEEFSDDQAPSLVELRRKVKAVEKALKYMTDHGLEPGVIPEGSEASEQQQWKLPTGPARKALHN